MALRGDGGQRLTCDVLRPVREAHSCELLQLRRVQHFRILKQKRHRRLLGFHLILTPQVSLRSSQHSNRRRFDVTTGGVLKARPIRDGQ